MEAKAYAEMAQTEDRHWWFEGRRRIVRDLLQTHLRPRADRRILDVGCGTGGMFPLLSEFGHTEGADGSADAIGFATSRFPAFRIHAARLPDGVPAGPWDVISAFDVIEHLDSPVDCLRAMTAELVLDGQVVITVPAYQALWSSHDEVHHHKRRYTRALLTEHLTAAGLRVTYSTHFNTWLLPLIASVRLAGRVLGERAATQDDSGDLRETPGLANRALTWLFASERFALRRTSLGAGVSIFAVAERAA